MSNQGVGLVGMKLRAAALVCPFLGHLWFYRRSDANRRYCKRCGRSQAFSPQQKCWIPEATRIDRIEPISKTHRSKDGAAR